MGPRSRVRFVIEPGTAALFCRQGPAHPAISRNLEAISTG